MGIHRCGERRQGASSVAPLRGVARDQAPGRLGSALGTRTSQSVPEDEGERGRARQRKVGDHWDSVG